MKEGCNACLHSNHLQQTFTTCCKQLVRQTSLCPTQNAWLAAHLCRGYGTLKYQNGEKYEGYWKQDKVIWDVGRISSWLANIFTSVQPCRDVALCHYFWTIVSMSLPRTGTFNQVLMDAVDCIYSYALIQYRNMCTVYCICRYLCACGNFFEALLFPLQADISRALAILGLSTKSFLGVATVNAKSIPCWARSPQSELNLCADCWKYKEVGYIS